MKLHILWPFDNYSQNIEHMATMTISFEAHSFSPQHSAINISNYATVQSYLYYHNIHYSRKSRVTESNAMA